MINVFLTALLLLLLGDFVATFVYHVPEHVFGKFHSIVHHSSNRSFIRYALRHRQPIALIDGFLSAFPYLLFTPWLWQLSPLGVVLGLLLGELHVIWRHQFPPNYRTPNWLKQLCHALGLSTPERHWQHHQNARLAYGDIFAFYGPPARWWLKQLMTLRKQVRQQRWARH
ncbi:MAG TPA: sterol desaturase family protein [Leptolyngbyaceae cyanobacterium]